MNAGVILPNTSLYGGVKRFFELGSILNEMGHNFTIFSPDAKPASWFKKNVKVLPIYELNHNQLDILFFTEKKYFDTVLYSGAKYKVFYHVRQSDKVRKIVKNKNIHVFACSTNIQKHDKFWYNRNPFLAVGGINSDLFKPKENSAEQKKPFVIMAYGRLAERRKGTKYIVKACEKLYLKYPEIKLLLFDTPVNQKMQEAIDNFSTTVPFQFILNHPIDRNLEIFHQADLFVSAEKNAGWANTVAEAMASGVPVIATKSGTLDMIVDNETGIFVQRNTRSIYKAIEKLLNSPEKRQSLALNARKQIEKYDWHILAEKIENWYNEQEIVHMVEKLPIHQNKITEPTAKSNQ